LFLGKTLWMLTFMGKTVLYEKRNHFVYITINRPEVLNYIDPETDILLAKAFAEKRKPKYTHE